MVPVATKIESYVRETNLYGEAKRSWEGWGENRESRRKPPFSGPKVPLRLGLVGRESGKNEREQGGNSHSIERRQERENREAVEDLEQLEEN